MRWTVVALALSVTACGGGTKTPNAPPPPSPLVAAAVGTWTCETPNISTPLTASVRANGTFNVGVGGGGQTGRWTIDATGVHLVFDTAGLKPIDLFNPALDTPQALSATTADMKSGGIAQTLHFAKLGADSVTFRADQIAPGVSSDTWTCVKTAGG
jgi:hypothetical protein